MPKAQRGLGSRDDIDAPIASKRGPMAIRQGTAHEWTSHETRDASHQQGAARNRRITGPPERGESDREEI